MQGLRTSDLDHGAGAHDAGALTAAAAPDQVAEDEVASPHWRFWPLLAMLGVGLALISFVAYSWTNVRIPFGYFSHPPIYGKYLPVLDQYVLLVIPAGVLLAVVGWLVTSAKRVPSWLALVLVVGCGVAAAAAIGLVRGDWHDLVRGVSTAPTSPYYTHDLHYVYEYGVRGFAERHPELSAAFHSASSKTHPPGVLIFLYGLFKLFGASHTLRITTVIAALALSAAAAAWSMGRTLGGERAGRIAAVLFVAAPGPLMLAFTNLDVIFATVISTAVALFMLAIHRVSAPIAAAAGAVLGLGTLLTFATSFVALAAAVAVVIQAPNWRGALRLLAAAAAAGAVVLALAHLVLGFDLWSSYRAVEPVVGPYVAYFLVGSPAAWLIYAGLPIAALGIAGLVRKVPGARRPVLPLVLVVVMVAWAMMPGEITRLRAGEVERTWAFLYPMLAATAGPVVDRWTRAAGRWSGAIVAALVVVSLSQAVLLQALWDTYF